MSKISLVAAPHHTSCSETANVPQGVFPHRDPMGAPSTIAANRRGSSSSGESMTLRSLRPLPCSMRMIFCELSM